jgi:hypothetical protein
MIDWIVEKKVLEGFDVYSKDTINDAIYSDPELLNSFYDVFPDELNYVRKLMPVHSNLSRPVTDASLTVKR